MALGGIHWYHCLMNDFEFLFGCGRMDYGISISIDIWRA